MVKLDKCTKKMQKQQIKRDWTDKCQAVLQCCSNIYSAVQSPTSKPQDEYNVHCDIKSCSFVSERIICTIAETTKTTSRNKRQQIGS